MRIQLQDITAKYLKEQTQRKLLYNKVQELRGNIRVFCRVRQDTRGPCALQFPSATELVVPKLQGGTELIEFEHCYGPNSKQETIFSDTRPIILSCVDGYNVCIIAYGQTGSGKTYTMMGPLVSNVHAFIRAYVHMCVCACGCVRWAVDLHDRVVNGRQDNPGVNRRAVTELVQLCAEREEVDYEITASMMEVYNEHIYDLLTESRESTLSIRQAAGRTFVDGAKEVRVQTQQEIFDVMEMGDRNRSVGATQMNTDSSRSHLLFRITVKGVNKISKQTTQGTLTLVDLAGSERVSKTDASGDRLVEAAAINKSLSALGQVFKALASNAPHVPYRNSKLTHALSDSLGGDSKTAVFVNVSPLETNLSETLMTLKFGQGIRKIELGPAKRKTGPPKPK
ncbi:uncharacterized protein MONBRDRAFT_8985 [Monosiga brevicollis MX1]|uniref:Kinesin-like protein n=1 Tax=Monosiga brevicollis TaxID=81824 RepID=A9V1R0_MONBE|nr:uncharacterized protein MONBRDRAFT_8985 [Monosiga brevicollis MX1]EDQ88488.1 predicted protein [Monosiga brevicollis MX1]|eukprot:XP_001746592.1 hypothetical protein [Monosiga brevicollis MX1]